MIKFQQAVYAVMEECKYSDLISPKYLVIAVYPNYRVQFLGETLQSCLLSGIRT